MTSSYLNESDDVVVTLNNRPSVIAALSFDWEKITDEELEERISKEMNPHGANQC